MTRRSPRRWRPRCGRRPGATTSPRFDRRLDETADADWVRDHARRFVRPAGAAARALRCGRQPYGVLPVTSLAGWTGAPPTTPAPSARVGQVLAPARPGVASGARSARPGRDAATTPTPTSSTCSAAARQRRLPRPPRPMGPHYLRHLRACLGEDLDAVGLLVAGCASSRRACRTMGRGFRARAVSAGSCRRPRHARPSGGAGA